jgi:hypothetical protein
MGSRNTHNVNTLRGTVLRTSSPRIRNYADSVEETGTGRNFRLSQAAPRHIHVVQVMTQQQKLHDSSNVPSDRFNVQFRLRHGSPTHGDNPAGDAHDFLFFHVRPGNQKPTITCVDLCHKNGWRPWFTETRVIRYQPFVLVHNARFYYQCYTNDKVGNQTYENNVISPTNIRYLKTHVRN